MIEKIHGFAFGNCSIVNCDCEESQNDNHESGMNFALENGKLIRAWIECAWCHNEVKEADIEEIKSALYWWDADEEYNYIFEALKEYIGGEEE